MIATTKRINKAKYASLLVEILPRPIQSEAENDRALKIVDRLLAKGDDKLTAEESVLLELLIQLIERFEEQHYALPEAPGYRILQTLMGTARTKTKISAAHLRLKRRSLRSHQRQTRHQQRTSQEAGGLLQAFASGVHLARSAEF